jgi:hypothetical protein
VKGRPAKDLIKLWSPGISRSGFVYSSPIDSIDELHLSCSAWPELQARESEKQTEVLRLLEEFRDPLLRHVMSKGLSPDDGEEVTQEVFLALFRHLQAGKPRLS